MMAGETGSHPAAGHPGQRERRIGYDPTGNFRITAYVRNAFDEQYYTSPNVIAAGDEFSRLGEERLYAIRLDADL